MRFRFLCLALLVFAGCTSNQVANLPTLRGPIVPTRLLPTATHTPTQTETPSPTLTLTATETPSPTLTLAPTDLPPTETPSATSSPTLPPSDTPSPTVTDTQEIPSPTVTDTQETPSPTVTDTQEIPSPTVTDTPDVTIPAPTNTPDTTTFIPFVYTGSTWVDPVEIVGAVTLGTPTFGTVDDQHPAVLYTFSGAAGDIIDIELTATDDLDPYLMLLDPKGREIVRNDDLAEGIGDSAVRGVILPESGAYIIVATRFGQAFGDTFGDFELSVSPGTASALGTFSTSIGYDTLMQETMNEDDDERIYTFRATAGDVITIQMTALTGNLDSNVTLTDNLGNIHEYDDDNLLIGTVDASIPGYIIPRTGFYSIVADHYRGEANSGEYRLKLALDRQNAISRFAVLDWANSLTLGEEGDSYFFTYIIGDWFNDADEERSLQVLLTFHLPPASERTVEEAVLTFAPCREYGSGLDALGGITIYSENFGDFAQMRNPQRPQPGATILSTQASCAPLILTELVQDAYANGRENVQFRLLVRDLTDNGDADQVSITPNLVITFAE